MNPKNQIARRRFLRGLGGVMVGLPALDIFYNSRGAHAQAAAAPVYSALMLQQNGALQGEGEPDQFWPRNMGTISAAAMMGEDADRATSELAAYADKLNFVRGLDFHYSNNHDGGPIAASTGAPVVGSDTDQLPVAESIDYFIASKMTPGKDTLTLYAGRKGTFRDDAFSFGPGGELRIGDNNPWNVYQRVIGLEGVDPEIVQKIMQRRLSVNDLIRQELNQLLARTDLSTEDRQRMDLHLSSIRDMEMGITEVVGPELDPAAIEALDADPTANENMEAVVRMQLELIAFAFASDRARTATLQVGGCNDHTRYMINGVEAPPFHYISHRVMSDGGDGEGIPDAENLHHEIDRIHARYFLHFLDRMAAYTLPTGGTLLDSSVNLWVNSVSNGPAHSGDNVPHVLAGSAGGFLKTGQHIELEGYTSKVLNTIATACGVRTDAGDYITNFNDDDPDGMGVIDELINV